MDVDVVGRVGLVHDVIVPDDARTPVARCQVWSWPESDSTASMNSSIISITTEAALFG